MKLGILLPEALHHDKLPAAAAAYPGPCDVVPIIVRDRIHPTATIDALRRQGREPVVYLTSHGWDHKDPATWDVSPLRDWPKDDSLIVRFDQEPNGQWAAPWALMEPAMYRWMFATVTDALNGRGLTSFTPIWTGRATFEEGFLAYKAALIPRVGLDIYATQDPDGLARNITRAVSIIRRHYSGPIDIWEAGILRGLRRRRRGLRRALRASEDLGIERFVYLDRIGLDAADWASPAAERHDWRFGGAMRRAWKEAGCG